MCVCVCYTYIQFKYICSVYNRNRIYDISYVHTYVCVCVCIYICKQTGQEKSVVLILLYGVRIIYRREREVYRVRTKTHKSKEQLCMITNESRNNKAQLDQMSEKAMAPHSGTLAWKIPWMEEPGRLQFMGSLRVKTRLSGFTFAFHFNALEKEMATHSSVLAWRIPGTGEPGGLPSMGSHRVGHH